MWASDATEFYKEIADKRDKKSEKVKNDSSWLSDALHYTVFLCWQMIYRNLTQDYKILCINEKCPEVFKNLSVKIS